MISQIVFIVTYAIHSYSDSVHTMTFTYIATCLFLMPSLPLLEYTEFCRSWWVVFLLILSETKLITYMYIPYFVYVYLES